MFLKNLINPKPSIIFFFIIFCLLFALFPLIKYEVDVLFQHDYLHPIIVLLLALTIPFFLSTGLNNIIYEKNIIRKENLVVGSVFILLSASFINTVEIWIASFLLLFLFNYLLESYQKDLPFSQFYNASIILGLVTLVFPKLVFLIALLIISGINYSNLSWRIIATIFLGFLTPYLFYFVFSFVTEKPFILPEFFNFSPINLLYLKELYLSKIIWVTTLLLVIIFSFFELFIWLYKKSIKSRRTFMTIIWFLIVSVLIAIYSEGKYFYFSLIPLSVIIGNYFVYTKKRKTASILFFMLIISSFYYKYMIVFNV